MSELKDIKTQADYQEFKRRVDDFIMRKKLKVWEVLFDLNEPHFSNQSCECCQRPLAGDRYDMVGKQNLQDDCVIGFTVCPDCMYYLEYGKLDDATMQRIEWTADEILKREG